MSEIGSINSFDDQPSRGNNNSEGNNVVTAAPASSVTSVFIGLGPAAYTISDETLRQRLEEVAPVIGLRIRGHCAFADVQSVEDAERLVAELDGKLIGEARMSVQISRSREKTRATRNRGRNNNNNNHRGRTSLFVGLGPSGGSITDRELRSKLEEAAPIVGFRRCGQCAFVDVVDTSQASKMIQELNNQYIGDCRLSVQYSRDSKHSTRGGRGDKRDRSLGRSRGRQRSRGSPDGRRRRRRYDRSRSRSRSRSDSRSDSRSSSYSDDSRDYRRRDRRRRERSRSYDSRSRSSSHSYRRRRD